MKKTLALLLALLLLLTAVACDKGDSEATNITTTSTTKQETSGTESSTTSTTASSSTSATTTEKVPSDVSTTSKTSTTKTTITTTTTTTKKPTTSTTKNVVVPTIVHPTVSQADTLSCIYDAWMADGNFSRTETSFQFQYDIFFGEVLNAKYPIAQINVISATVDGGRNCQIYQTTNKDKAYATAKKGAYISEEYANFDDQLIAENIAQIENVCRIVSPPLDIGVDQVKRYTDFTITVQVIFENGAVTTVSYVGTQSVGIGGWGLLDDSDFQ